MKIMNLLEDTFTLYRGVTKNNLPVRYPGLYYTLDPKLAQRYAKDNGTVYKETKVLKNVLDLRKLKDREFYENIVDHWEEFIKSKPGDQSETQFYDILNNGVTDFSYPTEADVAFLKRMGYDAVYFHEEGGEIVRSFFIPN